MLSTAVGISMNDRDLQDRPYIEMAAWQSGKINIPP
jgi:hypothetical protein